MVSDALQLRAVGWAAAVAALGTWALLERRGAPTGVALAAQLLAAAPPLAHTSGCRRYSRYRLLAPFEGGFAHVALQALGWTLYAAALTACLALLRAAGKVDDGSSGGPGERASSPFGGLFLAVGLAGFAAHGLIDASVVMYSYEGLDEGADGECDAIRRHARARLLDACGWFLRTRWGRLGAMLQAMSALLLVAADGAVGAVPDAFVRSVVGVSVMGTTLAASVAHGVLGCWARGAPLWAPFEGGERYVPLQALGWLLLAAYLNTIMCLLPLDLSGHAADGTLLATALIGCAAVLCLMASVGNWDPEAAAPLRAPHRARLSGRLPLGGEAAVAACLMFAASIIAASCRRTSDGRAALCGLPASVAGRAALPVSYGIAIRIAILGMHLAAPIAHAGGMRLHGSPYSLYQPFSGGPAFIFAQMLGWTLYGASALASLVVLSNADSGNVTLGDGVVRALFPLAFFAQAVVLASVRYFDAGEGANTERDEDGADAVLGGSTDIAHNAVPSEGAQVPLQRGAAAGKLLQAPLLPAPPEPATLPWTADTAFALFLSAMAASTVAAADLWGAVPADARRPLTAAGMVAFVIALCVGALAGNGRAFVHDAAVQNCRLLLQGLGYSLAALAMVAQLTMLQNALQDVPRGAAALSGALQLAANTLVTCASVYGGDGVGGTAGRRREAAAAARREKVAQLALAAVDESLRVARDGATAAGGGGGGAATALREASTTVALRAHPGVVALLEALALELSGEAEAAHAVDDAAWRLQDRRVTRLQSARLWRGGSLAAAVGALLLALFADGALLLAEVGTPHLRPAAPVLLAASTVAGVAAALGVHCGAGPAQHGGSWRLVGPFIGGRAFVLRSAVGWSLCSSALVLAVTALYVAALSGGRSHARAHGVATCVGFMMVAGHRALTEALDRYVPALAAEATDHMSGGTCECGTVTARARDAMVLGLRRAPMGAVVAAASTALFALSDSVLAATATRPSPYLRPALACAAAAMLGSGPLALGASLGSTGDRVPRRLCEGAPAIQVIGALLWSSSAVLVLSAATTAGRVAPPSEAAIATAEEPYPAPGVLTFGAFAGLLGQVAIAAAAGVDASLTPIERFRRHLARQLGLCRAAAETSSPQTQLAAGKRPSAAVVAAREHNSTAARCALLALPPGVLLRVQRDALRESRWAAAALALTCRQLAALSRPALAAAARRDAAARAAARARGGGVSRVVLRWLLPRVMLRPGVHVDHAFGV